MRITPIAAAVCALLLYASAAAAQEWQEGGEHRFGGFHRDIHGENNRHEFRRDDDGYHRPHFHRGWLGPRFDFGGDEYVAPYEVR